jgi:hypothetical protein
MKLDKRIEFEERYEKGEETTLYFIAPKEFLYGKYPEAEHAEISIEFPTAHPEARYAQVEISPTRYDEEEDCYTDYDWREIQLPYEEIEALINLANASCGGAR